MKKKTDITVAYKFMSKKEYEIQLIYVFPGTKYILMFVGFIFELNLDLASLVTASSSSRCQLDLDSISWALSPHELMGPLLGLPLLLS